jgi:TolB-like protein
MKKIIFAAFFVLTAFMAFSQRVSTVAVFPFESSGGGVTQNDAAAITGQVVRELRSWGTLQVVEGNQAESADYLVRGQLSKTNTGVVLSATTFDAKSGRSLNSSRSQAATVNELSGNIFSFCSQVVEHIPFPNYMLGKWRSAVSLDDSNLVCILEFRSNRTVRIEQYDTYERRGERALKYRGYGDGTYAYVGHAPRNIALKDSAGRTYREISVDGSTNITVSLEDALPRYGSISQNRLGVAFNEAKDSFELVNPGLLCGGVFRGSSDSAESSVAYTVFTKIQ